VVRARQVSDPARKRARIQGMTTPGTNRVLVVEDEPIIRSVLEEGLTDAGYHVMTAHNGAVALDSVRRHRPDAVLLDLLMPVMDGLAFLRERQAHPGLAKVPVVVLSAAGLPALRDAVALRATAALSKPIDLDVLSTVLDHVMRDFARPEVDDAEVERRGRELAGNCPICGATLFARIDDALSTGERIEAIHTARRDHVMSHSALDIAHIPLRTRLLELPSQRRRILADWMYRDLRQEWGDSDQRAVHSIDEALNSVSMRRLWYDATSCGGLHCQHNA
jgi:CheY-like chemotaxis protein